MAVKIACYFPIFWQKNRFSFIVHLKLVSCRAVPLGKRSCMSFQGRCHQPAPFCSFLLVSTRGGEKEGCWEGESVPYHWWCIYLYLTDARLSFYADKCCGKEETFGYLVIMLITLKTS